MDDLTAPPRELAMAYAQKYWEAANSAITAMFGLVFAVFLALVVYPETRLMVHQHYFMLLGLAIFGNGGIYLFLCRASFHEIRILSSTTENTDFVDSIKSAFHLRVGLLIASAAIYLGVITFVYIKVSEPNAKQKTFSVTISTSE
jgi:hypothetical protein